MRRSTTGIRRLFPSRRRIELLESRRLLAELSGFVYIDANENGLRNATEIGIPGVVIELTGTDTNGASVELRALTAQDGSYAFIDLNAGDYQIREIQPETFRDGQEEVGSQGGTASDDLIEITNLLANDLGRDNNFAELGLEAGFQSKRFFLASSDNAEIFRNLNADAVARTGDLAQADDIRNANIPSVVSTGDVVPSQPNRNPDLAPIMDQPATVNQQISIPLSATDPDNDNLTFIVDEDDSPNDASIVDDGSGPRLQFTPNSDQAGTSLDFRILVIDDGEPPLSDAEEFVVTVSAETNNVVGAPAGEQVLIAATTPKRNAEEDEREPDPQSVPMLN